jgi:RNA polymerase sigma-70 factor (ECF subfamily)
MEENSQPREQEPAQAHLEIGRSDPETGQRHSDKEQDSLAARLTAGDREAAAEFVDRYHERIYRFMRRLGHGRQLSEDLTQETFLRAWRHIGQLRNGKALEAWLYRIAGNVSKLYWRRHKVKESTGIESIAAPYTSEAGHDVIGRSEEFRRLQRAVDRLSRKLRQAIVLHYMQQLSISEAAEAAGISQGTFKSRLNRALNTLRKHAT